MRILLDTHAFLWWVAEPERSFRQGAPIDALIAENLLHPHLRERVPKGIAHLYGHQERAIRAIAAGRTTLVSTGTGSGKTECFLYPIVSRCLHLRDEAAPPGISAVIVYPMNALAEDQLMRLRALLAGTGIPFGIYVGKTPEGEAEVAGVRLPAGSSRADYEARLERVRRAGSGETVYPPEEVCSREAMRATSVACRSSSRRRTRVRWRWWPSWWRSSARNRRRRSRPIRKRFGRGHGGGLQRPCRELRCPSAPRHEAGPAVSPGLADDFSHRRPRARSIRSHRPR